MEKLHVKIVDAKGEVLFASDVSAEATVLDLKELFKARYALAQNLSSKRIGFYINGYKGRELFDHGKHLKDLFKGSDALVSYKDLGPVFSQQLVYNIYYIGPTLLTVALYFFHQQIYG